MTSSFVHTYGRVALLAHNIDTLEGKMEVYKTENLPDPQRTNSLDSIKSGLRNVTWTAQQIQERKDKFSSSDQDKLKVLESRIAAAAEVIEGW